MSWYSPLVGGFDAATPGPGGWDSTGNRYCLLIPDGYPPDLRAEAVKLVMEQAEALCAEWVG